MATPIGPGVAGQIHALCYDPDDPDIVYLGGDVCGVYRSVDGGDHWAPFWQGLVDSVGGSVMYVDDLLVVADPDIPEGRRGVYAATHGGLFFFPAGGDEWRRLTGHDGYAIDPDGNGYVPVPIPFSALGYDEVGKVLFVGAGTARWYKKPDKYGLYYPDVTFKPVEATPGVAYSVWRLPLGSDVPESQLYPVSVGLQTSIGHVRQIATAKVGSEGFVAVAAEKGFYLWSTSKQEWEDLTQLPHAPQGGESPDCFWGVAFGDHGVLYGLQHRHGGYYASVDTVNVTRTDHGWVHLGGGAPVGPAVYYDGARWDDLLSTNGFDLTRLMVVPGSPDTVYVGSRQSWLETAIWPYGCLPGGLFQFLADSAGSGVWRHVIGRENLAQGTAWTLNFRDPADETRSGVDLGWCDVLHLPMTVPLLVSGQDSGRMLAWMYQNPLRSDDGGATWTQVNAAGSDATGWQSNGANLMVPNALAQGSAGQLVVGCEDVGTFVEAPDHAGHYRWWSRWVTRWDGRDTYRLAAYRDTLYAIISSAEGDTEQGSKLIRYAPLLNEEPPASAQEYTEIDEDIYYYYQPLGQRYWITDLVRTAEDEMFVTVKVIHYRTGSNTVAYYTSDLWWGMGGGTTWTWTRWNADSQDQIDRQFERILRIPGTNLLIVGARGNGDGISGGLFCFDRSDPTVCEVWLDGEDYGQATTWLQDAAALVVSLATDSQGTVLYVGTRGNDRYESSRITTGTVLRLTGPFDHHPVEDEWEVLANRDEDTFGIGENEFHKQGSSWSWNDGVYETARRMTDIRALAVDPRDPRVVYVGLLVDHMHPSNGVWRYDGAVWQQLSGGGSDPSVGVFTLLQDAQDPTRLYVGTAGQELFEVTVPEVPEAGKALYVDQSEAVSDGGQGLDYAQRPYAVLAIDYDDDTFQDLLVSFGDPTVYSKRYANTGEVGEHLPRFRRQPDTIVDDAACRGLSVADYDNDGRPDVFVAHQLRPKLLHNVWTDQAGPNDPAFEDVASVTGLDTLATDSWCGAWGDYDRDGQVDLLVGRALGGKSDPLDHEPPDLGNAPNHLLRNKVLTGGFFQDRSDLLTSPRETTAKTISAAWGDLNGDGRPDLVAWDVGNRWLPPSGAGESRPMIYIQKEDGTFADASETCLPADMADWAGGVALEDYDLDGDLDLFVTGELETFVLLNDGTGCFATARIDLFDGQPMASVLPLDFDLDNLTDYLVLPHDPQQAAVLYRSTGKPGAISLLDVSTQAGLSVTGEILGAAAADLNGQLHDGDLDLLLARPAQPESRFFFQNRNLFLGDDPTTLWAGIRLQGDGGTNGYGLGAEVKVTIGDVTYLRHVDGGGALGGQRGRDLIFALPDKQLYQATIHWPDGYTQTVTLAADTVLTVYDDSGPSYIAGSFSCRLEARPGEIQDWVFEWDTQYSADPTLERVYISDNPRVPATCWLGDVMLRPSTPGVSSSITRRASGGYHHKLVWHSRPCQAGCSYSVRAESGTRNPDGTPRTEQTERLTLTASVCLPDM